jgi:flagellar protein FlbD
MISVSRLGGKVFYVNPDLIEIMEETPDTVITLLDGTKYVVCESTDDIIAKIIAYRREVFVNLPAVYKE